MRQRDNTLTTTAEPLYEVNWRGKLYTLTQQQLDAQPQLRWYARKIQGGDVLELDYADADTRNPSRLPSSARRYYIPDLQGRVSYEMQPETIATPRVRAGRNAQTTTAQPQQKRRGGIVGFLRGYPLVAIIFGMACMALLVYGLSSLNNWWTLHQQDVTYGRPRTYQVDAVVGHNDSATNPSHFIFLNLNRHVLIIELPGGDSSKARIYNGPTLFGDEQNLTPVTGSFQIVCGGTKPDMLLHIQDQTTIYKNTGDQFTPATPQDHCFLPPQQQGG